MHHVGSSFTDSKKRTEHLSAYREGDGWEAKTRNPLCPHILISPVLLQRELIAGTSGQQKYSDTSSIFIFSDAPHMFTFWTWVRTMYEEHLKKLKIEEVSLYFCCPDVPAASCPTTVLSTKVSTENTKQKSLTYL